MEEIKTIVVEDVNGMDTVHNITRDLLRKGKVSVTIAGYTPEPRQRTIPQNSSLHKYCATISGDMNNAGFTQRLLVGKFKEGFELPVTPEMIKDIFREVGLAMFKKKSTKELSTVEVQSVYQVVDQRFAEITGVRAEWPSKETYGRPRNEQ